MIDCATVTYTIHRDYQNQYVSPTETITFAPPVDHPALVELIAWHLEQRRQEVLAQGPGSLTFL